jgi:hypothetical protein
MGSMSASDAAPLPRLGEVYFDVRGESRSMRLSWYADTGVAVFSIWQGGTCTGTFRLPIADLPRMVEALQRGPRGGARGDARDPRDARGTAQQPGRADQRGGESDTGLSDPGSSAAYAGQQPGYSEEPPQEYLDPPGRGHRSEPATAAYREDQGGEHRRAGAHGRYDAPGGYEDEPTGVYRGDVAGHGYQDEPGARYRDADYAGDPLTGRYPVADPHPARYPDEDPHRSQYRGEESRPARYPEEDARPARYSEDPLTGEYPADPHTGDYPAGAGYPDSSAAYSEDTAGYPENTAGYPPSTVTAGHSPARPYVAPAPGNTGPAAEGRGHGRRRTAEPEESDLSAGSFPYGRPPAEPEPPRRGR